MPPSPISKGRSIVRSLGHVADAARGIARGRLGDRVGVRGRDEFASLGHAFNEMADQLEARVRELEEERRTGRRFASARLAATHDIDQLLRVIVESAVESTGASMGQLVHDGRVLIEVGEKPDPQLEFPLGRARDVRLTRAVRPGLHVRAARERGLACRSRGDRACQRQAAPDRRAAGARRRAHGSRESPPCTAALEKELARAERFGEPLALVLIDIDDFKDINDRWGHPTGDEVLKAVAEALQASVREIDLAGRWGGEEFALLLPGTDLQGGRDLAERATKARAAEVHRA